MRTNSNPDSQGAGAMGGEVIRISSLDEPAFKWLVTHPTTGNHWGTTRVVNAFRESILAYSGAFNRNYVLVATGDWTVVTAGQRATLIANYRMALRDGLVDQGHKTFESQLGIKSSEGK